MDLLRTGQSAADAARLLLRPFHKASAAWLSPGQPLSVLNLGCLAQRGSPSVNKETGSFAGCLGCDIYVLALGTVGRSIPQRCLAILFQRVH